MSYQPGTSRSKRSLEESGEPSSKGKQLSQKRARLTAGASFADVLSGFQAEEDRAQGSDHWKRPNPNASRIHSNARTLVFQCTDIRASVDDRGCSVIQLFGTTGEEHSVMACVSGFYYYLDFPVKDMSKKAHATRLSEVIETDSSLKTRGANVPLVACAKLMALDEGGASNRYIRVSLFDHRFATGVQQVAHNWLLSKNIYESDESLPLVEDCVHKFVRHTEIACMTWVKIPRETYNLILVDSTASRCQIEIAVNSRHLKIVPNTQMPQNAPLRILSFDIETDITADPDRLFGTSDMQPVIQIGNMVKHLGDDGPPFIRTIFTLDTCDPIEGTHVISCTTETELLKRWQTFVNDVDPDIIIGFNIVQFDIPFLINRSRELSLDSFAFLGRLADVSQKVVKERPSYEESPIIEGRITIDMMLVDWDRNEMKTRRNLQNVSLDHLKQQKEDISFKDIPGLQYGDSRSRKQLAVYCMKDTYLPLKLFDKLEALEFERKRAKNNHTTINKFRTSPTFRRLKEHTKMMPVHQIGAVQKRTLKATLSI